MVSEEREEMRRAEKEMNIFHLVLYSTTSPCFACIFIFILPTNPNSKQMQSQALLDRQTDGLWLDILTHVCAAWTEGRWSWTRIALLTGQPKQMLVGWKGTQLMATRNKVLSWSYSHLLHFHTKSVPWSDALAKLFVLKTHLKLRRVRESAIESAIDVRNQIEVHFGNKESTTVKLSDGILEYQSRNNLHRHQLLQHEFGSVGNRQLNDVFTATAVGAEPIVTHQTASLTGVHRECVGTDH